jgi:hypothetical protein
LATAHCQTIATQGTGIDEVVKAGSIGSISWRRVLAQREQERLIFEIPKLKDRLLVDLLARVSRAITKLWAAWSSGSRPEAAIETLLKMVKRK